MDRNINWSNNNADRFFSDNPEPPFRTSQVWLAEKNDAERAGVEIIELHSRESSQSPQAHPFENDQSHMWSYAKSSMFQDIKNSYAANQQARLKRRLRNKNLFTANDSFDSECDDSCYFGTPNHPIEDIMFNPNMNCFTILDSHSPRSLDSSWEEIEDESEPTRCGDVVLENACNGNGRYEEVISYNSPGDTKRTIWIYSFKNRRLLRENDYELENIHSRSTTCSTSGSPELEEDISEKPKTHVGRVASPIPKTYIPRLDLSSVATLPNVTEVTEPKSSHSLREKILFAKKSVNGWLLDRSEKLTEASKENRSTNVVNWMALSPRERRRRSRHTNSEILNVCQLQPVAEVASSTDEKIKCEHFPGIPEEVISKVASPINTQRSVKESPNSSLARRSFVESLLGDRGDYNKPQIPHINLDRKPLASATITEPIEKLESNLWITEESKPRQELRVPYRGGKERIRVEASTPCAGDKLMARNMALLKPSEWRVYSPIAGSRFSLQLSLASEPATTSLLQRCIDCFNCCKYRFH